MKKLALLLLSCLIVLPIVGCKEKKDEAKTFEGIYSEYRTLGGKENYGWMSVSSDYKTLSLDTKPIDDELRGFECDEEVIDVIYAIHEKFNVPSYVINQISETSKADGKQQFENDALVIWWTYSSTAGLEITYGLK